MLHPHWTASLFGLFEALAADELQFRWLRGLSHSGLLLVSSALYESRVLLHNRRAAGFRLDCRRSEGMPQSNFLTTDLLYARL